MLDPIILNLLTALVCGLMIGVERGWRSRGERAGRRVAGLRTFGLVGLTGGIAGTLFSLGWAVAGAVMLAAAAAALVVGYWRKVEPEANVSATHAIAVLLALGLGAVAAAGLPVQALAAASLVALLLASRTPLHRWLAGLSEAEIQATTRFALIAMAIWPLLPNARFGPLDAWNLRELWGVVVLVTGFSFAGYLASRRFGTGRGVMATAAIGGLYSSTAVIAALSTVLRERPAARHVMAAGIAIASAVMFARVLVLTAILAMPAVPSLALATGPAAVMAVLWAVGSATRAHSDAPAAVPAKEDRNPLDFAPALGFAVIVAAMALATRWAEQRFGRSGIEAMIAITGSFDVDAAIVTVGGLGPGTIDMRSAGLVLAIPVLANTLFKAFIVLANGGAARWAAAAPLLASAALIALALATTAWLT